MKTSIMTGKDIYDEIKILEDEIKELNEVFEDLIVGSRSRVVIKKLHTEKSKALIKLVNTKYQIYRTNEFGM